MAPRRKKSFATGPITSHLRLLFRRFRQGPVRKPLGPDESRIIVVDIDHASRTVDASVDAESQPQGVVLQVQSLLPPECPKLNPGDVVIHGDRPARAGSFADVWDGTLDGVRVVIKSYRLYSTADPTHPCMRLCGEALACSLLSHRNIVPFRAVYITREHPLALVYDFMPHRSLREYVKENSDAKRVRLLVGIARGLHHMHDLDIIHGNLTVDNILVGLDGTARIAGLGSAFISSRNDRIWSEMGTETPSYGTAPELMRPNPQKSGMQSTKESDIYSFGLLAWHLFAGHAPFQNIHPLGAIYSLMNGVRPPRPPHPELSDKIWGMIEGSWNDDPSLRPPIKAIVALLEEISNDASHNPHVPRNSMCD